MELFWYKLTKLSSIQISSITISLQNHITYFYLLICFCTKVLFTIREDDIVTCDQCITKHNHKSYKVKIKENKTKITQGKTSTQLIKKTYTKVKKLTLREFLHQKLQTTLTTQTKQPKQTKSDKHISTHVPLQTLDHHIQLHALK